MAPEAIDQQASDVVTDDAPRVPTAIVGFEIAARLLQQPPERIARSAAVLGVETREELRKLSETLEKYDATLTLVTPAETRVKLTKQRAQAATPRMRAAKYDAECEL